MVLNTVEIETVKPAKIILPNNINTVLLLNNSLPYPLGKFKNDVQEGLFKLDTLASQQIIYSVSEILKESPRFDSITIVDDIYFRRIQDLFQPIEWNGVNKLCSQYSADALLSLEAFGIKDTIIEISYYDGYVYHTYHNLVLFVNTMWRMYLDDDKNIFEKYIQRDTIYIDEISSKNKYLNALTTDYAINYFANKIAPYVSIRVADRMAPYWQSVQRDFFVYTANKHMKQAARYVYDNNWYKAASIWRILVDNENYKIRAAACHNMALACEVEGKLDIAIVWLKKSLEINYTDISNTYLRQLKLRLSDSEILNKQFGVK